jgi:hypothetical protein
MKVESIKSMEEECAKLYDESTQVWMQADRRCRVARNREEVAGYTR